jgi:hypothetical protein
MKKIPAYCSWIILFIFIVSACGQNPASLSTPVVVPVSTDTALPTLIPAPTLTLTPAPTATPTLHPLEINAMRAREYPGSDIVIEQTLDPGVNYNRYYVSYLSEGLKSTP